MMILEVIIGMVSHSMGKIRIHGDSLFFKNNGAVFTIKKDLSKKIRDFSFSVRESPDAKTISNFFIGNEF